MTFATLSLKTTMYWSRKDVSFGTVDMDSWAAFVGAALSGSVGNVSGRSRQAALVLIESRHAASKRRGSLIAAWHDRRSRMVVGLKWWRSEDLRSYNRCRHCRVVDRKISSTLHVPTALDLRFRCSRVLLDERILKVPVFPTSKVKC
jgi:hypothetical protein